MGITVTSENNIKIIKPESRLDAINSEEFQTESATLIKAGESIILDFSDLEYISSAGLRSILFIGKKAASVNSPFAVAGMKGTVAEVFNLSGFSGMIKAFETVEEARVISL